MQKLWKFAANCNGWTIQRNAGNNSTTDEYRLAAYGHLLDHNPVVTVEGMMTTLEEAIAMARQQHPSECG